MHTYIYIYIYRGASNQVPLTPTPIKMTIRCPLARRGRFRHPSQAQPKDVPAPAGACRACETRRYGQSPY